MDFRPVVNDNEAAPVQLSRIKEPFSNFLYASKISHRRAVR